MDPHQQRKQDSFGDELWANMREIESRGASGMDVDVFAGQTSSGSLSKLLMAESIPATERSWEPINNTDICAGSVDWATLDAPETNMDVNALAREVKAEQSGAFGPGSGMTSSGDFTISGMNSSGGRSGSMRRSHQSMSSSGLPQLLPFPKSPDVDKVLANVENILAAVRVPYDNIYKLQNQLFSEWVQPPPKALVHLNEKLEMEYKSAFSKLQEALGLLEKCNTVVLAPSHIFWMRKLREDCNAIVCEVEVLREEILYMRGMAMGDPNVKTPTPRLRIVSQPFPFVYPQKAQVNPTDLYVKLVCGTGRVYSIKQLDNVVASIITDARQVMETEKNPLGNNVQALDSETMISYFPIQFNCGTRKEAAFLCFTVNMVLQGPGGIIHKCTLESNHSHPFVVMTNQKQWENCSGTLLRKLIFQGKLDVMWPKFANELQDHFLKATRQPLDLPTRSLSHYDMAYIQNRFFREEQNLITQKSYEKFWGWYGKSLQVLRYQRHICVLFLRGLMYGFMTREDVHAALSQQRPGTFVIRFSENHAGLFGVAYISNDPTPKLKHYLVKPTDTAAAKITLPDFLRDKSQFIKILQLQPNPSGRPHFEIKDKHEAFNVFYANRNDNLGGDGYDPL